MAYKLLDMAEKSWRCLNGAELLPQVRSAVRFIDGVRQEPENHAAKDEQLKTTNGRRPAA